jgi:hypothetical protein
MYTSTGQVNLPTLIVHAFMPISKVTSLAESNFDCTQGHVPLTSVAAPQTSILCLAMSDQITVTVN